MSNQASSPLTESASVHVVVLEDDDVLRDQILAPNLRRFGFDVVAIGHPRELGSAFAGRRPDIVVLDVGLPERDGYSVSRELRATQGGIGIVMLTGRGDSVDRVRGLGEGADAYLTKPVDVDVLGATLHSLARRLRMPPVTATAPVTSRREWTLDNGGWALRSPRGSSASLTKTESRLLSALLRSPNNVVPREDLIGLLTDNVFEFDPHRLDSIVHRLRRKIRGALGEPLPLTAVHGEGYVFVTS
ncbi:response regulator transcription factor [Dyella japonica]|uniref:DNA-binding response OmpR family regulator n=1 Tax=Dyella japonica TaxID=231455 RepID=A0ABV2JQI8_9GAMM